MITAEQLKDVVERADALHRYLDIDRKQVEFEEEQLRTQAPDFWADPERAQAQMKLLQGRYGHRGRSGPRLHQGH